MSDSNSQNQANTIINKLIPSEHNKEINQDLKTIQQQWNHLLAKQALEALNQYLIDNKLNPQSTEIFQCINEIYQYSYNNTKQQIDIVFVSWIAERFFIRNLR